MEYKTILFEKKDQVGIITINRPQVLNALNSEVLEELDSLLDKIAEDESITVVILTGAGEKSFVAGADISQMRNFTPRQARYFAKLGQKVLSKLERIPQPVIAAVNGFALGGGCEIAMACDFRIASTKAKFGQPEVGLGVTAGFGGTQRLPRLVGKGMAAELLYTGEMIDAQEALRIGLVNRVVEPEELMPKALEIAQKIAAKAKLAVFYSKAALNEGLNMDLERALAYEAEMFALCFTTSDQKEGMDAFLNKRKPEFKGE
ncbi:short-chain-enoyl-CoA hydratase [Carboxydothermus ferrireducens]|uniref:Enoyl-CoA hydratase n=1 Tax=Carboxydothermus ferrireducens DSM 11255 TaxID=1119529 RepID=A0ABX2RB27_9THEO|nr:short-chain-enoyl-CoA hydratase [Carboxydothermus ferrireducens]NYE58366.1 enoyl-CoA hydratase [Carboxydothermus ferrireducens DSM 11255]